MEDQREILHGVYSSFTAYVEASEEESKRSHRVQLASLVVASLSLALAILTVLDEHGLLGLVVSHLIS